MTLTTLGPFRIDSELGSGGMGKVYAATVAGRAPGLAAGTQVALKVVHPHLLETPGFFQRFLREADIGRQVEHENVVRTHMADALMQGGVQHNYLVMEYVEGQTLRDLLVEIERLPEELCRHVGREVARGLAAIHAAGAVHRDLKPENVLITEDQVVKVMDLGVAQLQNEVVQLSQTGAFVGSIHYAAPEQFGEGDLDHRADLHALGLVLYELACGQHPYYDEDFRVVLKRLLHEEPRRVSEINPQLSPFLEEVIHTLMAKDREERFATATELAELLEQGEESEWWEERAKALRIETKQPLRRIRIPRETALYGRDDDLAKLRKTYDEAASGEGRVLLVSGEAGIGKTRLVDEFVGMLRQDGEDLNFLFGGYPPGGAATASGAFSTAYREHYGSAGLEDLLAEHLVDTPLLIPAFAALLLGDATPEGKEPLTKDSLQTVFVHATRALAAERPTIVLIDDLHFAPDEGQALFAALALAVPGHRVLLVGTTRPGLDAEWVAEVERLDHCEQISLARIGPKDLMRLLEDTLRSKRLAEELGLQIVVKSDGNPLFAFEIIRGLREGKFITQSADGSWSRTQVIDKIQIPSTVMDLIEARIADLTEEEKDLLDVAACCGFEFDPGLVAAALDMKRIPALKRFGAIEKRHRLIRSAGRHMVFDHYQVQEALYESILEQLREEYHGALAEALEEREKAADKDPKDLDGALCVELCEHYLKGARGGSGVRYLGAALDHLGANYLNDQAVALADRALEVPGLVTGEERIKLLLRKAGRYVLLGGRREAQRSALDEALSLAEELGASALRARAGQSLGAHLAVIARFDEAHEVLSRALQLARESGDAEVECTTTGAIAQVFQRQGRFEEAREQNERSIALAREIGDRGREGGETSNLGNVFNSQGHQEEALEHYERSLVIHREVGNRVFEGNTTGNVGNVYHAQGRDEMAREYHERALTIHREVGNRRGEAIGRHNLAEVLKDLGDLARAREQLDASQALAREIDVRILGPYGAVALASIDEAAGDHAAARAGYERAVAGSRDLGLRDLLAGALTALGWLLAEEGRPDEARPHLEEAFELARETGAPGASVLAPCHVALLPGGDSATALAALAEYETRLMHAEHMKARFLLWEATADPAHLAEAKRLLDESLAHAPAERHEAMLTNVPLHRDIAAAAKEAGL